MLGTRKLFVDAFSEVYPLIKHLVDGEFWDLSQCEIVPGAVYIVSRQQATDHSDLIRSIADSVQIIIGNSHEGSETLIGTLAHTRLLDLGLEKKIWLIGGGAMPPEYVCLSYDKFLPEILDYEENLEAATHVDEIYSKEHKPYKFLFLNGRSRSHRVNLINQLKDILDSALWTNLDAMGLEMTKTLPPEYEVPRYSGNSNPVTQQRYVKPDLFQKEWGEIYLHPPPYIDTYFSVVTETVFDIPYSFRTEKIWKPIVMGHPWIAVANRGFYRDMHNLGFRTFKEVINESFDLIDNNHDRLLRIADIVRDLCQQNLVAFLRECYNICKYNQYHHREIAPRIRQEFPAQFTQFFNERFRIPPASAGSTEP